MKRITVGAIALTGVLLAGGAAYLLWSLDARVERAIEGVGSRIMGTRVSVDSVDIDLRSGTGTIRGLSVENPQGFSKADAIRLDEIELAIDTRSLRAQPFELSRVRIGESTVQLEVSEQGASNIGTLAQHIAREPAHSADEPASEVQGQPRRFAIDRLSFAGGRILLLRPGAESPDRANLPELDLTRVGGEQGDTGGEIGKQIAWAFTRRVAAATAGHELGRFLEREIGGDAGSAVGEAAGSLLRRILD